MDPSKLSPEGNQAYEASLFVEQHPDYFVCPRNRDAMIGWMAARHLQPTYANMKKAFETLTKSGEVLPGPEAFKTIVASGSDEELRKLGEQHGIPRYNFRGKLIGYDFPPELTQSQPSGPPQETRARDWRKEQEQKKIAMMTADQFKAYSESRREWQGQ